MFLLIVGTGQRGQALRTVIHWTEFDALCFGPGLIRQKPTPGLKTCFG